MFKKILSFLIIVLAINYSYSQDSYIMTKKGKKIIIKNGSSFLIKTSHRLSYQLPNGTWEKFIKFKQLDYVIDGPYKIKTFDIENKKKPYVFYVNAEFNNKVLGTSFVKTTSMDNRLPDYSYFNYCIIENGTKVINSGHFKDSDMKKSTSNQKIFINTVKKEFSGCQTIINLIENLEKDKPKKLILYPGYIFKLFTNPINIKCNE